MTPRAKITGARAQPRLRRRQTKLTPRAIWALVGLGSAVFLIVMLIILIGSPAASDIVPADGCCVAGSPLHVEASLKGNVDPAAVTVMLDGEDRSAEATIAESVLAMDVALEDGEHTVEVMVGGKLEASSRFILDNTPPALQVDEWEVRDDGITVITGRVEGADALMVDEERVGMEADGTFQVEVSRFESTTVTIAAVDAAGNRRELLLDTAPPPQIKGIHVSIWVAADRSFFKQMADLVEKTELNGMQIDVKDESGRIAYPSQVALGVEVGSPLNEGGVDIDRVMDKCWYNDIYPIARIVCFKDPVVTSMRPDLAVQSTAGGRWGDGKWLDPYSRENWDYILGVAVEAAGKGFKEIQLDYVRFPSDGDTRTCVFPSQGGDTREKKQVINDFLKYMRDGLKPLGVALSADVFGLIASPQGEMGIGQDVTMMGQYLDYMCPMVYPSHYNTGEYEIANPEANPHDIVYHSLVDFQAKLAGTPCKLRPWLQDFSLSLEYGVTEVQSQIRACYELNINEWLLWDPHCTFTEAALQPAETPE
ncbi:MAG: putative glycoside hydrolase [Actinobacteria bacterium]|nr:putative glycoside hydrolase [Actinomycetota bacterium]